jgi:hypothetical protein
VFAIKAEILDPQAKMLPFTAHKTMYGGKLIFEGAEVFVFASETQGGQGLIARGIVTHAEALPKKRGIARQTPRGERHHPANNACEATAGPPRARAFHRLEGRLTCV